VLLSLCLLASITSAQTPGPTPSADDAVARLSAELEPKIKEEIQQGHLPGFSIGVVKNGKLIYAKGFGVAKLGATTMVISTISMGAVTSILCVEAMAGLAFRDQALFSRTVSRTLAASSALSVAVSRTSYSSLSLIN